jgi:hypothetical protein
VGIGGGDWGGAGRNGEDRSKDGESVERR